MTINNLKIFDEKAIYDVSSKIDSFNTNYRKTTNIVEVNDKYNIRKKAMLTQM